MHEEISFGYSGLPGGVKGRIYKLRYWNDGWLDEIQNKLSKRNFNVKEQTDNDLIKTENNFLMKYAIEYAHENKHAIKLLQKINVVRKYKGILLPFDLFV